MINGYGKSLILFKSLFVKFMESKFVKFNFKPKLKLLGLVA